jgi:hypothetical protein
VIVLSDGSRDPGRKDSEQLLLKPRWQSVLDRAWSWEKSPSGQLSVEDVAVAYQGNLVKLQRRRGSIHREEPRGDTPLLPCGLL